MGAIEKTYSVEYTLTANLPALSILSMRFRPLSWGFWFNIFREVHISFAAYFVGLESAGAL